MTVLVYLIPAALLLGALWLVMFLWTLKNGQYEDLDGAALRVLDDSDIGTTDRREALDRRRTKPGMEARKIKRPPRGL